MQYRPNSRQTASRRRRNDEGSILPIVVISLLVVFAFLGMVIDVMRQYLCVEKLRYAAQAAALDILPFACQDSSGNTDNAPLCTTDGAMNAGVRARLEQALNRSTGTNSTEWNSAPAGNPLDSSKKPETQVLIESRDLSSAGQEDSRAELSDRSELVLRVRARRTGDDALSMIFTPVAFAAASMSGQAIPQGLYSKDQVSMAEVYGQPAARIGAGAPPDTQGDTKAGEIWRGRLACFPLLLEYNDFNQPALVAPGSAAQVIKVRAVNPGSTAAAGRLRGHFVNIAAGSSISGFYKDAKDAPRRDELIGLLRYFDRNSSPPVVQPTRTPQAVERGVHLDCFDSNLTSFDNGDLRSILSDLSSNSNGRCFILPVGEIDGGSQSKVTGFAWLKLLTISEPSTGVFEFQFEINESIPVLNASASGGLKSIPTVNGDRLPAPPTSGPFASRAPQAGTNTIPARPRGVVLAPVLSPRTAFPEDINV